MGHVVETAVFAHMSLLDKPLYYARWGKGQEVDLVMLDNYRASAAMEVKWSDPTGKKPLSLIRFCKKNDIGGAFVTSKTEAQAIELDGLAVQYLPAVFSASWSATSLVSQT